MARKKIRNSINGLGAKSWGKSRFALFAALLAIFASSISLAHAQSVTVIPPEENSERKTVEVVNLSGKDIRVKIYNSSDFTGLIPRKEFDLDGYSRGGEVSYSIPGEPDQYGLKLEVHDSSQRYTSGGELARTRVTRIWDDRYVEAGSQVVIDPVDVTYGDPVEPAHTWIKNDSGIKLRYHVFNCNDELRAIARANQVKKDGESWRLSRDGECFRVNIWKAQLFDEIWKKNVLVYGTTTIGRDGRPSYSPSSQNNIPTTVMIENNTSAPVEVKTYKSNDKITAIAWWATDIPPYSSVKHTLPGRPASYRLAMKQHDEFITESAPGEGPSRIVSARSTISINPICSSESTKCEGSYVETAYRLYKHHGSAEQRLVRMTDTHTMNEYVMPDGSCSLQPLRVYDRKFKDHILPEDRGRSGSFRNQADGSEWSFMSGLETAFFQQNPPIGQQYNMLPPQARIRSARGIVSNGNQQKYMEVFGGAALRVYDVVNGQRQTDYSLYFYRFDNTYVARNGSDSWTIISPTEWSNRSDFCASGVKYSK